MCSSAHSTTGTQWLPGLEENVLREHRNARPELRSDTETDRANLDQKIELKNLKTAETKMARAVNAFLLHLRLGDAATRVQAAEDSNGFEAWRSLCRSKLARSSAAAMGRLMEPTFASRDPRVNLQQWEQEALAFEQRFGEPIQESLRKTVYLEKIAPKEMKEHILMNQNRLSGNHCDDRV